jgi:hypothetical protein
MSAKAPVRHSGNVAVFDLTGRIALGGGSRLIRNTIKDLLNAGRPVVGLGDGRTQIGKATSPVQPMPLG